MRIGQYGAYAPNGAVPSNVWKQEPEQETVERAFSLDGEEILPVKPWEEEFDCAIWENPDEYGKLFLLEYSASEFKNKFSLSKPKDGSGALTQRLVSAGGQFEVRQVLIDANQKMLQLQLTAALGGEDAQTAKAYIRKLDKLINRAYGKLSDLDKEDALKHRQKRAEKEQKRKRAEEIKEELRRKTMNRRHREQGYLIDLMQEAIWENGVFGGGSSGCASEAAITAQAEAMAAAEVAAVSSVGGGDIGVAGGGGAGASADAAPAADGGGME